MLQLSNQTHISMQKCLVRGKPNRISMQKGFAKGKPGLTCANPFCIETDIGSKIECKKASGLTCARPFCIEIRVGLPLAEYFCIEILSQKGQLCKLCKTRNLCEVRNEACATGTKMSQTGIAGPARHEMGYSGGWVCSFSMSISRSLRVSVNPEP